MHVIQWVTLPDDVLTQVEVLAAQIGFAGGSSLLNSDLALLSESEHARALCFYVHADQVRSTVPRTMLVEKTLLRSETLHFVINEYGKLSLKNHDGVEFNVSHSRSFALIALSTD